MHLQPACIAARMCIVFVLLFACSARLSAQSVTPWNYNGSAVLVFERDGKLAIRVKAPSDELARSGAQMGSMIFLGERNGNALFGAAYKFYGPQCGALGFPAQGTIQDGQIILQGIAPGLGISCRQETTYYATLVFKAMQVAEPQFVAAPAPAPPPAIAFPALATTASTTAPVYLLYPFRCVIRNGQPVFERSDKPYYHEALDYQLLKHQVCPNGRLDGGVSICQILELNALRLVCKGGVAGATALTLANGSKRVRFQGDSLFYQIYNGPRASEGPENYHRLPTGFGLVPLPAKILTHDDFIAMYNPAAAPVPLPESFFLTLYNWAPVPQLIFLPLFLAAVTFAFFGFYVNPESRFSPRGALFWLCLVAGFYCLNSALVIGKDITDAYGIGARPAASPFVTQSGHLEPFRAADAEAVRHPARPQTEAQAEALAQDVAYRALLLFLPVLLILAVYARYIYAGYHYLFVAHPAQEVISTALRSGALVDLQKLAAAFRTKPQPDAGEVSLTETLAQTINTQALHDQVQADAALAEALMRRDRARAMQAEAEKDLREARGKLSFWQRIFGV